MALLRSPSEGGWSLFRRKPAVNSARATAAAFKVGEKTFKKDGVPPLLREVVRLHRESKKAE